jgi:hypothetical protein
VGVLGQAGTKRGDKIRKGERTEEEENKIVQNEGKLKSKLRVFFLLRPP